MEAKIKEALAKLDTAKDDDWTPGGLPNLARVKELTGADVTRKEIADAVPGFNRANAGAAPSDLSNVGGGNEGALTPAASGQTADVAFPAGDTGGDVKIFAYDDGNAEMRVPTADEIAKYIPDPILLIEAFVIATGKPEYMRNIPLTNIARAWQVEQKGARELQARLDQRARERKAREAELEAAADNA